MSRRQPTDDVLLSVVVPAYNEAATIEAALRQLQDVPLRLEVLPELIEDAKRPAKGKKPLGRYRAVGAAGAPGRRHR